MIETASSKHLDAIMSIWLHTNISAHPFIPEAYWEDAFDAVKEIMPGADLYIYREETAVKGFIGITGGCYIAGLFVDGKFQSQGIGRALLDHCKRLYPRLELDVFTENAAAVGFYRTNGFKIEDTRVSLEFYHAEHRMVWASPESSPRAHSHMSSS